MSVIAEKVKQAITILQAEIPSNSRVLLFGSSAREDRQANSDLDLLVIEPGVVDHHRESVRLRKALRPLKWPTDVVVLSNDDIHSWGSVKGTFLNNALAEGKVLLKRTYTTTRS